MPKMPISGETALLTNQRTICMLRCMTTERENQALIADGAKKVTAKSRDLLPSVIAMVYHTFDAMTDEKFRITNAP